jgi:DNA-binding IclR family transcriptional regulator
VERVGRILDAFTFEHAELTLTECAQAAELNKTSAYRLLSSLEQVGLVERHDLRWRLGPKTVRLADVRLGRLELRREAVSHLRELRRIFRAAVAFSVPEGSHMIYLERLDSPDAYGVSARLGGRAPMWAGASGKALLSRLDADDRAARLDVDEWHRLPRDLRERVLREIDEAAARGYAVDRGEFFSGIGGAAVALRDPFGEPVAAISVIVSSEQLDAATERAISTRLRAAAAELERTLGALAPAVTQPPPLTSGTSARGRRVRPRAPGVPS